MKTEMLKRIESEGILLLKKDNILALVNESNILTLQEGASGMDIESGGGLLKSPL